jgi:nucleoside-diphosphate-sugar epimerase
VAADDLLAEQAVKVLVTGASGVIGRALTAALASSGFQIRAAVRDRRARRFADNVDAVQLSDLSAPVDWPPLLAGMDAVVHLAGIAHIGTRFSEAEYDRVNHQATAELAKAAAAAGIRRFVFASSIRAMAGTHADHPLTEQDSPVPTEPYGHSKLAAELAVRGSGVSYTILRPVLVYTPEAKGNLASLIGLARSSLPLPFGSLSNRRSLLAVENLIAAIRFALEDDRTANETFIVADPGAVTVPEIIAICRAALGRSPGLFALPLAPIRTLLTLAGQRDTWDRIAGSLEASPAKLLAAGWRPVCDTRTGLTKMVQAASPPKSGTASRSAP